MNWREISPERFTAAPVSLFAEGKPLLSVVSEERRNTMTVAWGSIGVFFGVPTVMVGVRPNRYTFELINAGSAISLSFLPRGYEDAISYCGTHSGREGDKPEKAGLHPTVMPCGAYAVGEAELVITAKKIMAHGINAAEIYDAAIMERWYKKEPFHTIYLARIEKIYEKA